MRSGREHLASMVAVEEDEEDEEEKEKERRRRGEETIYIKSNNPHLAGGESVWPLLVYSGADP